MADLIAGQDRCLQVRVLQARWGRRDLPARGSRLSASVVRATDRCVQLHAVEGVQDDCVVPAVTRPVARTAAPTSKNADPIMMLLAQSAPD